MKKNMFNIWLLAALVCGLSLSVTSCKDDDKDDNGNGNDPELVTSDTDTDEAKAAYNWLANMTDIEDFTDNWASKTYEPTIGIESKNESNTRIVVVADIDYAKMNFASISGLSISQLSAVQSQTIKGVGTITWTPSAAGASNLATVDVNTKLIPHLSKIVYCTVDQVGDNGGYAGTAYYRFGDVIEDTEGFYWVCVKPAFGTGSAPQQQGYWINILNRDAVNGKSKNSTDKVPEIPAKNIYSKSDKKYNDNTILLPTSLGSTKEQVHNLSNLVWALLEPEVYQGRTGNDAIGLGGYDYQFNGAKFCQRVAEQWVQKGIWEILFNRSYEQMKQMKKLNFFYNGYHWKAGSTAGVWIANSTGYASTFTGSKSDDDILFEMKEKGAGFDIRRYCSDPQQDAECASSGKAGYAPKQQFTSTEGYWVVRQKTSSQIAGTMLHPSVYAALNNTAEIYRYNQAYSKVVGSESPVEEEDGITDGECSYYNFGDVVKDERGNKWFCVQTSTFGSDHSTAETNYSYFVSYDLNAVSEDKLTHSKELAAQMLFSMSSWYHNAANSAQDATMPISLVFNNIKVHAGVDLMDVFAQRDTLFKTSNYGVQTLQCDFASTIYRNAEGKFCVLRLIVDYTTEQANGGRDMAWRFWDSYTADPKRIMLFDDLKDSLTISRYNEDEWVYLPWYNPVTGEEVTYHTGKLVADEYYVAPWGIPTYVKGMSAYNGIAWNNMYREPTFAFAVKRVKDVGVPGNAFEDGTFFNDVSLVRDNPNLSMLFMDAAQAITWNLTRILQYDNYLKGNQITLNGKENRFDFTVTNKP